MYVMILLDVKKIKEDLKNIIDESYTADLPLLTMIINFMLKNVIKKLRDCLSLYCNEDNTNSKKCH